MDGRIKIHRKILDREWYGDINTRSIFFHCIFLANFETKKRKGIEIPRGSFITSIDHLAKANGITARKTRLALERLTGTGELVKQTTNKYTLITVVGYDKYQINENEKANKRQTNGKQMSTTKEVIPNGITKENIMFEKIWKLFPHARPTKKETTKQNFLNNSMDADEIIKEINLLNRMIEFGIQDSKYVKAMERWIRDITPTSEVILTNHLKTILTEIKKTEGDKRKELVQRFKENFGTELTESIRKEINKTKTILKFVDGNKITTF